MISSAFPYVSPLAGVERISNRVTIGAGSSPPSTLRAGSLETAYSP